MAFTVFRSVESNRSLRFSRRETLSWVIPRILAMRVLCTFGSFTEFSQAHFLGRQTFPSNKFLSLGFVNTGPRSPVSCKKERYY